MFTKVALILAVRKATSTKGFKWDPHYYANIAANIASTQLPLVTALGMKNNIISCECWSDIPTKASD